MGVETALEQTKKGKREELDSIGAHLDACLLCVDEEAKGYLTKPEFMKLVDSDELRSFLEASQMDSVEMCKMFDSLQLREGEDFVATEMLSIRCKQLLATASNFDILMLRLEM